MSFRNTSELLGSSYFLWPFLITKNIAIFLNCPSTGKPGMPGGRELLHGIHYIPILYTKIAME